MLASDPGRGLCWLFADRDVVPSGRIEQVFGQGLVLGAMTFPDF